MEKLNELVAALYPQYATPGSRDIDVTERRKVVVESAAAIAEAFRALEQAKEAADRYAERLNTLLDDRDATLSRYEAKLTELEKPRYQIQKKPSYGRESVWIDVASREEAETNVLHGYRWRMVYDAPAPAADRVPEGWKLVPVEPTEEMIAAGDQFMDGLSRLGDAYDAMLAAAPGGEQ